jgi:hypothetical protein
VINWRIFYDGSEWYDSNDGGPETAPARGVQVIVQDHREHRAEIVTGGDYYVWRDERWWATDIIGLWDYLCMDGWKRVLFGRMIVQDEYNAVVKEATATRDSWNPKDHWNPGERRTT